MAARTRPWAAAKAFRTAFPNENGASQLVLVNGEKLVSVTLVTGKQSGPLKMPSGDLPPNNANFGVYMGQVLAVDDGGKVTHEWDFLDMTTLLDQLRPIKDHPLDGTNNGDLSMMHVKKTGKKLSLPALVVHRLDGGKVKATWLFFQSSAFASQLGLDQAAKK